MLVSILGGLARTRSGICLSVLLLDFFLPLFKGELFALRFRKKFGLNKEVNISRARQGTRVRHKVNIM